MTGAANSTILLWVDVDLQLIHLDYELDNDMS